MFPSTRCCRPANPRLAPAPGAHILDSWRCRGPTPARLMRWVCSPFHLRQHGGLTARAPSPGHPIFPGKSAIWCRSVEGTDGLFTSNPSLGSSVLGLLQYKEPRKWVSCAHCDIGILKVLIYADMNASKSYHVGRGTIFSRTQLGARQICDNIMRTLLFPTLFPY